jgi:pimeloyl-ACP methyl ester carboxylesterase
MTSSEDGFRHRHVVVADSQLHVVEAGDPDGVPFLFLHGWPESWQSWRQVMTVAARQARPVAIDLPGVGASSGAATDGSKQQLAAVVHELIATMDLREVTLVGQDVGGMIAYMLFISPPRRRTRRRVPVQGEPGRAHRACSSSGLDRRGRQRPGHRRGRGRGAGTKPALGDDDDD